MKKIFRVGQQVYACSSLDDFEICTEITEVQELKGDSDIRIYKVGRTWYKDDCVFETYHEMKVAYAYYQSKDVALKHAKYIDEKIKEIYDLVDTLANGHPSLCIEPKYFSVHRYDDTGDNLTLVHIDEIMFKYIGVDDDTEPLYDILYHIKGTNEWIEATENLEDYVYILTINALHHEFKALLSK